MDNRDIVALSNNCYKILRKIKRLYNGTVASDQFRLDFTSQDKEDFERMINLGILHISENDNTLHYFFNSDDELRTIKITSYGEACMDTANVQKKRFYIPVVISIAALIISAAALMVSIVTRFV